MAASILNLTTGIVYLQAGTLVVNSVTLSSATAISATGSTDSATSSQFLVDADSTLAAGVGNNTASINGVLRAILKGSNLTSTNVVQSALHGVFWVTGTDGSNWPKAAVIGEIHDNTTVADGAFVAVMGGDTSTATARAAFTVAHLTSVNASKFTYGLDLGPSAIGAFGAPQYATADLRFQNQQVFVALKTAITANSTTTTLPSGSIGITSNATGVGKLFMSDGSKWQFAVVA